jgi:quercetin dioxygenase-like cupin family protein
MFLRVHPLNQLAIFVLVAGIAAGLSLLLPGRPVQDSSTHIHAMEAASDVKPATTVKPLSCEKLADIPGKAITTAIVTFPPNAYSPAHRHPGSVTAYVLKGSIRSQLSGGAVAIYPAGATWFEPKGTLHLFAENASTTEPAELLTIFVADENCGPLVIPERCPSVPSRRFLCSPRARKS